ncbi:MAG: hypothetical protein EPO40_04695 [Myxococcaceae bacterium]|nr:MAG: hypothetical protein EPO40_04695 [Myxococcaceae bacterium]
MAGTRSGATTRITRSNTTTPRNGTLRASCQSNTVGQVAFRYTPTAAGRLAISTDNAGTMPAGFDTVAWALSSCAPSVGDAGTGNLGCDDDSGSEPRGLSSRFVTSAPVAAGTPIFIIVAGYGSATTATGTFELSVTEVSTVAVGGMCDPAGATSVCATGATCVGGSATTPGTCTAEGARGAACRAAAPRCDTSLECSSAMGAGTCRAIVAVGGACELVPTTSVCMGTAVCYSATMGATMGTCIAEGAANGRCRAMGTACDAGLACSGSATSTFSRCRTAVAAGAACDPTGVMNVCATGTNCVTRAGASTCVAQGAQGGACRTDSPRCDASLECSSSGTGVCRAVVAVGAACDTSNVTTVCAMSATCIATAPGSAMGTCRAAGTVAGTACRDAAPRCDTGLDCSSMTGSGICRRSVASGAACAPGNIADVCAVGTACLPTSPTAGTCSMGRAETEPNNTPMAAQTAITASTIFTGTATDTDADCFHVTVPMGGAIFAESSLVASTTCASGGPDPVIDIYNPANTRIAGVDDTTGRGLCGTLNPASTAAARNLPAGTYTVCIEGFNEMATNYLLTIGVYTGL